MNLIKEEYRRLANNVRLGGEVPSAEVTTRLLELSTLLINAKKKPPIFSEYAKSEGV